MKLSWKASLPKLWSSPDYKAIKLSMRPCDSPLLLLLPFTVLLYKRLFWDFFQILWKGGSWNGYRLACKRPKNVLSHCISLLPLGDYELVSILLRKGADPYISAVNATSLSPGSRGFGNAFAAAAAHGHKNILRKLLAEPGTRRDSDMLSLAEILSEGSYETLW